MPGASCSQLEADWTDLYSTSIPVVLGSAVAMSAATQPQRRVSRVNVRRCRPLQPLNRLKDRTIISDCEAISCPFA